MVDFFKQLSRRFDKRLYVLVPIEAFGRKYVHDLFSHRFGNDVFNGIVQKLDFIVDICIYKTAFLFFCVKNLSFLVLFEAIFRRGRHKAHVVFQAIVFKQIRAFFAVLRIDCKQRIFYEIAHFAESEIRAIAGDCLQYESRFRLLGKQFFFVDKVRDFVACKRGFNLLSVCVQIACVHLEILVTSALSHALCHVESEAHNLVASVLCRAQRDFAVVLGFFFRARGYVRKQFFGNGVHRIG